MLRRRSKLALGVTIVAAGAVLPVSEARSLASTTSERSTDFDHDGFDDLVIVDARATSDFHANAGLVFVAPGSATGPRLNRSQTLGQTIAGVPGHANTDDYFGIAWTSGRFDADAYDDLAVCVPGERVSNLDAAGAVIVFPGSRVGLVASRARLFSRATIGVPGLAVAGERWCLQGLAAGDFNRDGFDELVVASTDTRVGGFDEAGAFTVLPGSAVGLRGTGARSITQNSIGVVGAPEADGHFGGNGMAVGDFNGDGFDDLTVGAVGVTVAAVDDAGARYLFFGGANGLKTTGSQIVTANSPGIPGDPLTNGNFGEGDPAVADWNRDGFDDLLVADPRAQVGVLAGAGQAHLLRGSASGVVATGGKLLHRNVHGVPGAAAPLEQFGFLDAVSGDFDGNGRTDVALGGARLHDGIAFNRGGFFVLPGTATTLGTAGSSYVTQDTPGVPGVADADRYFSWGIWSADFNGDHYDDLVVPCSFCVIGPLDHAGYLLVFRGSAQGLTTTGIRQIKRSTIPGLIDEAEAFFGFAN
jgi:FG-GAP repeat